MQSPIQFDSRRRALLSEVQAHSKHYRASLKLGKLFATAGFRTRALEWFQRAKQHGQLPSRILGTMAYLSWSVGEIDQALSLLAAPASEPWDDKTQRLLETLREVATASDSYFTNLKEGSRPLEEHELALQAHMRAKNYSRALATLEFLIENGQATAHRDRVRSLLTAEVKLRSQPANFENIMELVELYDSFRYSRRDAVQLLTDAADHIASNVSNLLDVCNAITKLGNPFLSSVLLLEASGRVSDDWSLRRSLADALAACGCSGDAASLLYDSPMITQALQLAPRILKWSTLSGANGSGATKGSQIGTLRELVDLIFWRGIAHEQQGERDAARRHYIAAAALGCDYDALWRQHAIADTAASVESFLPISSIPCQRTIETVRDLTGVVKGRFFDPGTAYPVRFIGDGTSTTLETQRCSNACRRLQDGGQLFSPARPRVFGPHPEPTVAMLWEPYLSDPVDIACLRSARVVGRGFVIDRDDKLIADALTEAVRRHARDGTLLDAPDNHLKKAMLNTRSQSQALAYEGAYNGKVVVETRPCYLLDSGPSYHFSPWMMIILPRLYAYFSLDRPELMLVVTKSTSARLLEFLRAFGIRDEQLFFHDPEGCTIFEELWLPSALSNIEDLLVPESFFVFDRMYAQVAEDAMTTAQARARRVYLSRADTNRRRLVNEAEIEEMLSEKGFETVLPAQLSVSETVELFRNVDIVVGPSGSAFLNLVLLKRAASAIVIAHPLYLQTVRLFCELAGLRGLESAVVFGKITQTEFQHPHQESFVADVEDVRRAVESMIGV